jgi:acetyltransferase-like isoleucine patch superfamily enzyme
MNRLKNEFFEFTETLLSVFPGGIGKILRRNFYKPFFKKCGHTFYTALRVKIQGAGNIVVGDNVAINYGVWIAANKHPDGGIVFGNNILIGPYSIIHSGNHKFKDPSIPICKQGFEFKQINIEDDVWIAGRCTILAGVTLGKGSVVAAGAVVIKDVPPYTVVGGVPAREIAKRQ